VKRELQRRGVRAIFILPVPLNPATVEETDGIDAIREIGNSSGGSMIYVPTPGMDKPEHVFRPEAVRMLLDYYRIDIPSTAGRLKVALKDESGKRAKDLEVHFPRELNCRLGHSPK
jgi:hypothetical protein